MPRGPGAGTGYQGWLQRVGASSCRGTAGSTGAGGSGVRAGERGSHRGGNRTGSCGPPQQAASDGVSTLK